MSSNDYAQRRRDDRAAAAEQARRDADAAAERALHAEAVRAEVADRRAAERTARRQADTDRKRTLNAARRAAAGAWLSAHRIDLLIYPLAIASALMAVPAMAAYGAELYGGATGYVLPVLSELGMWAFALAVQARRKSDPEAPVWSLQVGVWTFAAVAAGLNIAHGATAEANGGTITGLVMGVVSIAGVIAHQLVVAGPRRARRTRDERAAARQSRAAGRKLADARRAALDAAVAEIDADGDARLVIAPGTYRVHRTAVRRRARLTPAATPGLSVGEASPVGEDLAAEITSYLSSLPVPSADDPADGTGNQPTPQSETDTESDGERPGGHGVATADRPSRRPRTPRAHRLPLTRSLDQLRAELAAAVTAGEVDPSSAESIRKTLRISPARARTLRDEHTHAPTHTTTDKDGDQR
ncbi:hypothetical protein Ae406Ps2_3013c [Pseudonocardia sp. Ae406_Ps2]|uniref:hypothetical protein n=1 Tax=unclassified Pseudonocardia TaxID=2619320 RepID=UPI00094ABF94|nr:MULTISPECIES: hypothetical protein [unclassified Pseudonocardia]OLL99247.1 hypothetical protein Ae331Ps2_2914 [Pseudonocardia sp. Ae331_Ps2]OLM03013.1 hypothetical protein Ae406Ps2_3013c [Pseudonocardia sp. Ae406_Ps2]OLM12133.1 hypothetical protein Ae505Ps2_2260 [Pseudonocardia sp. Ae505_Ps2]